MIERPAGRDAEDGYVGRSQSQAPDIDSVVHVDGKRLRTIPRADSAGESDGLSELRSGGESASEKGEIVEGGWLGILSEDVLIRVEGYCPQI